MIGMKALFAMLAAAVGGTNIAPAQPGYMAKRRPTGSALRNPNDPQQAAAIQFAAGKRDRKAEKLNHDLAASVNNNFAHGCGTRGLHLTAVPHLARLNPFHVAH